MGVRVMALRVAGSGVLVAEDRPLPLPGPGRVRVRVSCCGVCRTDLHVVDGELPGVVLPIVPGHQVVGTVDAVGAGVERFRAGDRIGVPWLGFTCGSCRACSAGRENLCAAACFTGYHLDGGFCEAMVVDPRYAFRLPGEPAADDLAPLLCAGLIGYRALRMAGEGVESLGLYGFGASAHIVAQIACHRGISVHAFTRAGDGAAQRLALELGAVWAGASDEDPPVPLDAAIIFAPVGGLVPVALRTVGPGGTVVCAGIHMTDIPSFPYHLLWQERTLRSVANLTRRDGEELLSLAPTIPIRTRVTRYRLEDANRALDDLRAGRVEGAAVLVC